MLSTVTITLTRLEHSHLRICHLVLEIIMTDQLPLPQVLYRPVAQLQWPELKQKRWQSLSQSFSRES